MEKVRRSVLTVVLSRGGRTVGTIDTVIELNCARSRQAKQKMSPWSSRCSASGASSATQLCGPGCGLCETQVCLPGPRPAVIPRMSITSAAAVTRFPRLTMLSAVARSLPSPGECIPEGPNSRRTKEIYRSFGLGRNVLFSRRLLLAATASRRDDPKVTGRTGTTYHIVVF